MGRPYPMGELYTILATQNRWSGEGTYKLPEAQLDRFLMKLTMDYPSLDEEVNILERHHSNAALVKLDDITVPLLLRRKSCFDAPCFMKKVFIDHVASVHCLIAADTYQQAVYWGFLHGVRCYDAGVQSLCSLAGT